MTYETLCRRLMTLYESGEAKAIARWVFDARFGLSLADILCGKDTQLSANDQEDVEKIACRLEKGEPIQYVIGMTDFCGNSEARDRRTLPLDSGRRHSKEKHSLRFGYRYR